MQTNFKRLSTDTTFEWCKYDDNNKGAYMNTLDANFIEKEVNEIFVSNNKHFSHQCL